MVGLHTIRVEGSPGAVPFVLVHGLASNARLWDGVAAALAARGHGSTAVDLRGHGCSDKPDDGYDVTTVTDDLAALLEGLDLDRPVVVGQSWGGNVVLELGWRFPALVRGVVGVDGGTIDLQQRFPSWEACRAALTPPPLAGTPLDAIAARLRAAHPDWPDSGIDGTLANFEVRADGTVAPWLTLDRHLLVLRGLWEHRPATRYPEMEVPVLFVPAGEREDVAAAAAAVPRCRVVPIDGDHDLHAQHPEKLAGVLADLVAEGFFS